MYYGNDWLFNIKTNNEFLFIVWQNKIIDQSWIHIYTSMYFVGIHKSVKMA